MIFLLVVVFLLFLLFLFLLLSSERTSGVSPVIFWLSYTVCSMHNALRVFFQLRLQKKGTRALPGSKMLQMTFLFAPDFIPVSNLSSSVGRS